MMLRWPKPRPRPDPSESRWRGGVLASAVVFTLASLAVLRLPALPAFPWLVLLSIPALLPWRGRRLWSVAVLAALLTVLSAQQVLDQRWPITRTGQEVVVEGIIATLPERSAAAADSSDHDKPADDAVAATDDEAPAAPALFT